MGCLILPSPGALDDGRGRARVGLFRHKHELETGRTSSVGMEVFVYLPTFGSAILTAIDIGLCAFGGANIAQHRKFH